jgi:protein-tyrosine phosphatase
MAEADGIEHIVATPHANDRYRYDRQQLTTAMQRLSELCGGRLSFSLGCDFDLSYENWQELTAQPGKYLIEGTRYLLVELSNYSIPLQIDECLDVLLRRGITPILTHPERNPILQRTPERVLQWVEQGTAVQVTASVLTGAWGERNWKSAEWLLKHNAVHVIASDAHDTTHRVPMLSAAREALIDSYGPDLARALLEENPRAIVQNKELPYFPSPKNA